MTENEVSSNKQKFARIGAIGGGVLGVAAIASAAIVGTGANWTDNETLGTTFESGEFDFQVNVGGETYDDTTVDAFAALDVSDGYTWGPGDHHETSFELQTPGTNTHGATLSLVGFTGEAQDNGWDIVVTDEGGNDVTAEGWETSLAPGEIEEINVDITFNADGDENEGLTDQEAILEFQAESNSQMDSSSDWITDSSS